MPVDGGASRHVPERWPLGHGLILLLFFFLPLLAACQRGGADDSSQAGKGEAAAADSSTAGKDAPADSATAADTTETGKKSQKNFFARLFSGKDEKGDEKKEDPVPVELVRAERRDLPSYLASTATLEPEKRAEILAKISGQIKEIRVEEGAWAKEGELLASLDGDMQRVVLEEAEAQVGSLLRNLERLRKLHQQQLASDKDLSEAEARHAEIEAQRKNAELQLAYTRIVAPFAGRISRRMVDAGQNVSVGTALFSIVDPDPLLASIHLPEKEVVRLSPEQPVLISPDTDPEKDYPGSILRIAPVVDERTGTVKVTCRVGGETGGLRPGSFVRVKLQTAVHESVLVIPKRALVPEGAESYVYKTVADSVLKIPIITGATDAQFVEVVDGLEDGDQIVTVGQGGLRSGSKVREISKLEPVSKEPKEQPAEAATPDSAAVRSDLP